MKSKSGASLKKLIPIIVVGAVVLSLLAGVAIATGALDIEVLTEMSKSLSYRLEYWTSTWDVILDHPLFGTGPGNFRDNYLRHKLPESSEEIADPHQFVLDVAANAGVIGLAGLLTFLAMIGTLSWKLCRQPETTPTTDSASVNHSIVAWQPSVRTAIGCAAAVAFAGEWLFSGNLAWSVLCVCLVAAIIDRVLTMALSPSSGSAENQNELHVPSVAVVAAIVALFVHLSAAGGIAMPAVIGIALAMTAVLNVDATKLSITDHISKLPNEYPSAPGDTDAASEGHFQTGPLAGRRAGIRTGRNGMHDDSLQSGYSGNVTATTRRLRRDQRATRSHCRRQLPIRCRCRHADPRTLPPPVAILSSPVEADSR